MAEKEPIKVGATLITSVRVECTAGHDRVTAWNRGACAGTLVVNRGDGLGVALRLLPDAADVSIRQSNENYWREVER
jgi:hypothetical protein